MRALHRTGYMEMRSIVRELELPGNEATGEIKTEYTDCRGLLRGNNDRVQHVQYYKLLIPCVSGLREVVFQMAGGGRERARDSTT